MFNKLKLKTYLLLVFGLMIILTFFISVTGTTFMTFTNSSLSEFFDEILASQVAAKNVEIQINSAARDVREMLIVTDSTRFNELNSNVNTSIANIETQLAILKASSGNIDSTLVSQYESNITSWLSIASRVIDAAKVDSNSAVKIVTEECAPALEKMLEISSQLDTKIISMQNEMQDEISSTTQTSLFVSFILFVVAAVFGIYVSTITTNNIINTTDLIATSAESLSIGDLKGHIDYNSTNVFGRLADRMNFSISQLSEYVDAIGLGMHAFANGDFTTEMDVEFIGDFIEIQQSIEKFRDRMNVVLSEINTVSGQVYLGAEQVSASAQTLAQGATEQTGSICELAETISNISNNINVNSENCQKANALGEEGSKIIKNSATELQQLLSAIDDISASAEGISVVIKVIDDIAFQTNILALNAAVEAARAGNAGKGFAVVADEVRTLAQRSAKAAKETTELIETSLIAVKKGKSLAANTSAAFEEVAYNAGEITSIVQEIAQASSSQANDISEVSQGVDQISSVVQMNSATSEESAAASEELSGQANVLKDLVSQFQIDEKSHM